MGHSHRPRLHPSIALALAVGIGLGFFTSCRSPSDPGRVTDPGVIPGLPETGAHFTVFPVDTSDLSFLVPLGWLSPPGHTFPSDHIYLSYRDPYKRHRVVAPVDGYLIWILHADTVGDGADYKLQFQPTQHFHYYLDHLSEMDTSVLSHIPPLHLGGNDVRLLVHAGQTLGWSGSPTRGKIAMDFGVFADSVQQPFVIPSHYNYSALHTDNPLHYYEPALRAALTAMVFRDGPDKEGKVCDDVDGTLAGNWFSQGATDRDWTRLLAFVPDPLHPQYPRVVMGGELGQIGDFALRFSAPRFSAITPASGFVKQALIGWDPNLAGASYAVPVRGWLMTQMLDAQTLKVEVNWSELDSTSTFTSAAKIYVR